MSYHESMGRDGGFSFGQGEASVVASSTGTLATANPGTPVRIGRLVLWPTSGMLAAEIDVTDFDIDDHDMSKDIGGSEAGPWEVFAPDSVVNPIIGALITRDTDVVVTIGNNDTGSDAVVQGGWRCRNIGRRGVEASTPGPGPEVGRGRLVFMGSSDDTGQARNGKLDSSEALRLMHAVIQSEDRDLPVTLLRVDDDDYITGGALPVVFFRRDCPLFSFGGRHVDKTNRLRLTTAGGTTGRHAECFTAQAA